MLGALSLLVLESVEVGVMMPDSGDVGVSVPDSEEVGVLMPESGEAGVCGSANCLAHSATAYSYILYLSGKIQSRRHSYMVVMIASV